MDKFLKRCRVESEKEKEDIPSTSTSSTSSPSNKRKRRYVENFLEFGFTSIVRNNEELPVCVLCKKVLTKHSLRADKLKKHLVTQHKSDSSKGIDFFRRHQANLEKEQFYFEKEVHTNEKYTLASFAGSWMVAKAKKPFTIAEDLCLPFTIKVNSILFGKEVANETKRVPFSDTTVARRISALSKDVQDQLIERIKVSGKFAIQLDESEDISKRPMLLCYVRFTHENEIEEEFLFCQPLLTTTTGNDIFQKLNEVFEQHGLLWKNCVAVCTDGAAAMTGHKSGLKGRVQSVHEHVKFSHCMIHREALVAKKISPELNQVLNEAVKIINFIKSRSQNCRIFSLLCQEMDAEYQTLLLHCEIRWLSKGKCLTRLVCLMDEVKLFLSEHNPEMGKKLEDSKWILKLAYLSDIFSRLNELNLSLQGRNSNIFTLQARIRGFLSKIDIWLARVEKGNVEMFTTTEEFLLQHNTQATEIYQIIHTHLVNLKQNFQQYFSKELDCEDHTWVFNPFGSDKSDPKSLEAQEELADLSSNVLLKAEFKRKTLSNFWLEIKSEFPTLSKLALDVLLPFVSTYLCESAFSVMTDVKCSKRSCIEDLESVMRPPLTNIEPRYNVVMEGMQFHSSH
jgi:hypothetical protein